MSDNVYAPPQADLGSDASPLGSGDLDIGRCLREGWALTWANFPLWLGVGIVFPIVMIAAVATILGIILLVPVLYWGAFTFQLRMYDGGASLRDIFAGFSRYGRALGGMLGFFGVSLLLSLPANIITQVGTRMDPPSLALAGVGNLLAFAVALFVSPRLSFAPLLMIDRGLSLGEALSLAWSGTGPVKWKILLMMLAMLGVIIAGAIALLVGMIPAMVVTFLMWSSAYRQIFGGAPKPAA